MSIRHDHIVNLIHKQAHEIHLICNSMHSIIVQKIPKHVEIKLYEIKLNKFTILFYA